MTELRAALATDTGKVRPTNQDMGLVGVDLVAVADGMGGHAAGEVAASIAVEALQEAFAANPTRDGLVAATTHANHVVFDRGAADEQLRGMGTTLTAAAFVPGEESEDIAIVNVGDSRAYLLEDHSLKQLTSDHSLVEDLVRHGEISREQAAVHPHRHILTRALGIDGDVEVDSWTIHPTGTMRILLCSDGLTNECSDEKITSILLKHRDPQDAAKILVDRALRHGGNDNITVVVADFDSGTPTRAVVDVPASEETSGPNTGETTAGEINEAVPPPSATVGSVTERLKVLRTERPKRPPRPAPVVPAGPKERLVTWRSVTFVTVIVAIIVGGFSFIAWFNYATYFVGLHGSHIAIYNGRPAGLLWFHPTLVEKTSVSASRIYPSTLTIIKAGMLESSFSNAKQVVRNLATEGAVVGQPLGNTTTPLRVTTSQGTH